MHMLDTTLAEWLKLEKNEIQNSEWNQNLLGYFF